MNPGKEVVRGDCEPVEKGVHHLARAAFREADDGGSAAAFADAVVVVVEAPRESEAMV
jgi:hypothetical protein